MNRTVTCLSNEVPFWMSVVYNHKIVVLVREQFGSLVSKFVFNLDKLSSLQI